MSLGRQNWKGRRKRVSRRIARDLRTIWPAFGLVFCFLSCATTIVAFEAIPGERVSATLASRGEIYDADLSRSISAVSAGPGISRGDRADVPGSGRPAEASATLRSR